MKTIDKMDRVELEIAALEAGLADTAEQCLKIRCATNAELRGMLEAWILAGDECAGC